MGTNNPTIPIDSGRAMSMHLGLEPDDKDSEEWKTWKLEWLKLKCDKNRRTIRGLRISNNEQIECLKKHLEEAITSLEHLKKEEIAQYKLKHDHRFREKEQECEQLTQSLQLYKEMAAFYKSAKPGDEADEGLKVRLIELEDHTKLQDKYIQGLLEKQNSTTAENKSYKHLVSDLMHSQEEASNIQKELMTRLSTLESEKGNLAEKMNTQADKIKELEATIESLENDKSALQITRRKLIGQVGSTAKSTFKSKSIYHTKQNLTQRSLNSMFLGQLSSSSAPTPTPTPASTNASTHNSPSPSMSRPNSIVETVVKSEPFVNAIPQKRLISTALSDKTNCITESIKSKKGKGPAIKVKHEQIQVGRVAEKENIPLPEQTSTSTPAKRSSSSITDSNLSTKTTSSNATNQTLINQPKTPRNTASIANVTSSVVCNSRHRKDRSNMEGDTCMACANFYGTEVMPANIHGNQVQMTGQDRIQLNSRHRYHRTGRAKTPPGFWDLDFNTP